LVLPAAGDVIGHRIPPGKQIAVCGANAIQLCPRSKQERTISR
jgi:hypothetical protein